MGQFPFETWRLFVQPALRSSPPFSFQAHKELVIAHLKLIREETVRQIAVFVAHLVNLSQSVDRHEKGLLMFNNYCDARHVSLLRAAKIPIEQLFGAHTDTVVGGSPCVVCEGDTLHSPQCRYCLIPHCFSNGEPTGAPAVWLRRESPRNPTPLQDS